MIKTVMFDLQKLQDDQKFALMKFRRNVTDILAAEHDDYFLVRWLRARRWNPEAAEKMLRASLKTRSMWNVDNIEKWDCPKVLLEYVPFGHIGYDKEGSPIIICPFFNLDMWGVLHCVTRFEFQKYTVLLLDRLMKAGYEQSKKHGPQARQFVVFFDVANFNIKQYAWRPAAELIITMVKQYEQNYPEVMKMCYIINAPKLFSVAYNFIKKFLDEYTMSKIKIFKSGSDKWKDQLFQHIDADKFPKYYGGNRMDPDGNPQCKSLINWGGHVPKEIFTQQSDDNYNDKNFIETTISKGNKLKLQFDIKNNTKNEQILSWEFRTFNYDIKFGIYSIDKISKEKRNEIELATVFSHEMDEIGFISCRPNTTYFVVFDNSNSFLRNKKLRYCVEVVDEIDDISEEISKNIVENEVSDNSINVVR